MKYLRERVLNRELLAWTWCNLADMKWRLDDGQIEVVDETHAEFLRRVEPTAVHQAIRTGGQFYLIQATTSDKIDFIAGQHGTHREGQLDRRQKLPVLGDREAYIARLEDVILAKMEYYR
ncbi:unnamed protein product [marine sediment metagenome]|uniref:Uncharacterized protein n=1 Tax=marine sediment metagenome TaxID=412755 RepID=X0RQG2_9ZZZZ